MLVSYRWLQDYVDISDLTPEALAEKITRTGIEVDAVEPLNRGAKDVVVGEVLSCEQHPNADKLNLCEVDINEGEPVQIVCGAPNVAKGQKVPVAKVGGVLPGDFKIKRAKLRGVESNGMICSLQELGVESKLVEKTYEDGIYVFPEDVATGEDALEEIQLNDTILDLDLTPNRADAFSMLGVAYEVAAMLDRDLKYPDVAVDEADESASDYVSVSVENADDTPYYSAMILKDVKVGPSPQWLKNRLMAADIRPINNIVDITNFVLLEYGQPLHAFDYDRLQNKHILVRRAREGEELETLDNETRSLTDEHLVITDGQQPIALAGVMGGAATEVKDRTATILLEAAYFDGQRVRKATKGLGLSTDASARYEKGIARNRVYDAAQRAASLMAQLADATVVGVVEAGDRTVPEQKVTISTQRINRVLGLDLTANMIGDLFRRLGFSYDLEGETFTIYVPSRRPDITIQEDIIEEVARLYGYDEIPTTNLLTQMTPGRLSDKQEKRRVIRRSLEGSGVFEAITYALTTPERNALFTEEDRPSVRLSLPMSEERSTLRTSLLPHLLDAVQYNHNRQIHDVALYENASVFLTNEEKVSDLPTEEERLALVLTGLWHHHPWQQEKKAVDFFVLKGILETVFEELGVLDAITFEQVKRSELHPGRAATISLDGRPLGFIGQVHPTLQKQWGINETYVVELSMDELLTHNVAPLQYDKLERFPSISRDIALVVDQDVAAGDVQSVIRQAGGDLLKDVSLFDLYQGEHMEEGKKSLAFSLRYVDPERTLTEDEVKEAHDHVLQAVKEQCGASLRS